ncbi:MAG: hypothetical protein ABSE51_18015 [Terracidiphilus sp.]|jgi:hypothetical protein
MILNTIWTGTVGRVIFTAKPHSSGRRPLYSDRLPSISIQAI